MSGDDELERLLREVDATLSGPAKPAGQTPATRGGSAAATTGGGSAEAAPRGRVGTGLRTGVVAGALCGAGVGAFTFFFQWLPFIDNPVSSAGGAFVGAFLTGAVLGARRPSS
ncbi:MAG: hypothetical protein U0S36_14330 [Candidatus Nanopelagicales bacterium]